MIQGESGKQSVLLVGEGDFSLTVSLRHQIPLTIVTSSTLLSHHDVCQLHNHAQSNIDAIHLNGGTVLYEIDATKLHSSRELSGQQFDGIIFNFPHTGGKSNIKRNRALLRDFFLSAEKLLAPGGVVCVTLAKGQGGTPADVPQRQWQNSWQVVSMASHANLILRQTVPFVAEQFPEYCSTGFRSQDKHFHTDGAIIHIFVRSRAPPAVPEMSKDPEMGTMTVNGQMYHFNAYVVDKVARAEDILKEITHPFSLVRKLIEEKASAVWSETVELCDGLVRCKQLDTGLERDEGRHYTGHVACGHKCCIYATHSKHLQLRSTLLEVLPKDRNQMSWYIGDVYRKSGSWEAPYICDMEAAVVAQHSVSPGVTGDRVKQLLEDIINKDIVTMRMKSSMYSPFLDDMVALSVTASDMDQPLAVVGRLKCDKQMACVLSLTSLAKAMYNIKDARLLWSTDDRYFTQFSETACVSSPLSLHALTWTFDMSFWEGESFSAQAFLDLCSDCCKDELYSLSLMGTFIDGSKVSRCYRLTLQSCDTALSYDRAHAMQSYLRLTAARLLDITLR